MIEEHGADEAPLASIDANKKRPTKKDLDEIIYELSSSALGLHNPDLFARITAAQSELDEALNGRVEADRACEPYDRAKSAKGKLGKKSITDRLEMPDVSDEESKVLQEWLTRDAVRAQAQKDLKTLVSERDEWLSASAAKHGETEEFEAVAIGEKLVQLVADANSADNEAKALQKALDEAVVNHYPKLSIDEIKALVVEAKWLARIEGDVRGELDLSLIHI